MTASPQNRRPRVILPAILLGIGALLIALALMLAFVVVPAQKVTPLDSSAVSITETKPANVLVAGAFAAGEPTPNNVDAPECRAPEPAAEEPNAEEAGAGEDDAAAEGAAEDGEQAAANEPAQPAELPMSCFMETDVPVIAKRQVYSVEPGDADKITLQVAQSVLRTDRLDSGDGSDALISATVDRITTDRRTGEPVEGINGSIEMVPQEITGTPPTEFSRTGVQYKWPFDPEQRSYEYFDLATMTHHPIDFVEETEVDGVAAYTYRQEVGPINMFDSLSKHFQETEGGYSEVANTILASYRLSSTAGRWGLEGDPNREVDMYRFYTNTRTITVSKVTGQILFGEEAQFQFFAEDQQQAEDFYNDKAAVEQERQHPTRTAMAFTGSWDQETMDAAVENSLKSENLLNTVGRIVPISLGIIGLLFVIGGLLTMRRRS